MASGKYDYLHKKNGYGKVEEVEYGDTMETVSASSDAPSANSYKPRQTKIRTSVLDAAHLRNDRSRLKSEIGKIQNTLVSGELYKNGVNKAAADRDYHNKYNRMKSLEKELAAIDTKLKSYEYDEYLDDTHKNNFGGRFEANLAQGRLSQDSSAAWNKYLSNPTDENRQLAEHIDYVAEQFGANNKKVLAEDGLISKSLANYLPQLKDQTKAQIIGGLGGAAAGAGVALGAGLLAPTPEEVVTVPTLAVKGLKTGITAASGLYSYGNMRGAAFRELISSGVDEETARAAASDEALISGLIEMADTGIDLATLGIGKLINNVGKFGLKQTAKQVAKEGTEAATEKSIKKVVSALGKYGLNIAQEAAEEGSQEIVSIANQQRALEGNTGKADLLLNSIRKGFNLNAAEKAQVLESAAEGAKIASMLGGATMVGTGIANRAIENRNNRMYSEAGRTFSETETVDDVIQTGLESAPETESYRLAQEIRAKREAGIEPTDAEIGKLHIENIRTINEEEANSAINAEETSEISVSEPFSHNDIREPLYNNGVNNVEFTNADRLLNELAIETQTAKLSEAENYFGENGKKAFRNYYQQENSVDDYYNGFSRFYEAGKVGLPFDKVNTVYSKGISPAVQYAAYAAGQNDEKVYLKRDKSASKVFYPKGNLVINEYSKKLSKAEADFYNRLSAITGNKIEFVGMDSIADGAADGSYSKGLINAEIGTEETRYVVISHEITHGLQRTSPQEYRAYRNYAVQLAEKSNGGNVSIVEQYSQLYKTDTENAMDEVAADFTKRIFKDKTEMERFINDNIQDNRSMLEKFFDTVKAFVDKIKNAFKGDKNAMDKAAVDEFGTTISELEEARRLWLKALKATDEKVKATQTQEWSNTEENNTVKYSLNPKFARQIDNWDGKSNTIFKVGTTSDALKSIGIKDKGIIWYGTKIAKILEKHHKITRDIIKQVPNILENPVLIMKSQKFGTRIVLMGELMDSDNNPIVAVLELQPTNKGGQVLDLNIIASAYVKDDNPIGFIKRSELLYIDENKERTEKWFNAVGLQLPSVAKPFGSIGKVTYNDGNVNIEGIPFREYMSDIKENTANANILQQKVNRSAAHNAAKRSSVSENNVAQYKTDVNMEGISFREYMQGNDIQFSLKNKNLDIDSRIPFTHLNDYINVSRGDSASLSKLEDAVKGIKRGTYVNKATEYRADINSTTIKKAIYPTNGNFNKFSIKHINNLNAIRVLSKLFEEAVYIDSKPPQKSKNKGKAIQEYHHFVAPLYMNNDEYRALITAREKTNSNTLYVLRVEVLQTKKATSAAAQQNTVSHSNRLLSDISVADLVNGVNIYDYANQSAKSYGIENAKFSLKRKKIDNGNEDTYNKYRWAMDNGLLSNAESAVFFENIGAIKRGEKFRKTYDGYYMIPTGENGINNTIVITDGNYIEPSIESVIKINVDNETDLSKIREDIYESKAGMHPSNRTFVRMYKEIGVFDEYNREDMRALVELWGEGRDAETSPYNRNDSSRQRNGRGSFGEDKNFSLKSDILKENAALKKYNEYLKAQMKLTKEYKVNSKQLDKLVKELIKENNSNIDKEELFNRLDGFYTYLQNSNELAWDDIKGKALDIAKDIIKESVIVNDEYYETYKELKRFLKNTDITISEAERADFPDGYNNFRKANFGRLKLVNDGTNIDSIYQELDDMFPEYFDAEQYITSAEQAQNIVDVLDMLSEYEMQPDNYYVEQGAQFLADDIIERYFDIPQEKPTFADKKQNELIHQKIESGKKIRSMREQRDKDIKENILATQMHEGAKAAKTRRLKDEELERIKQLSKERIKKLHKDKKTSIENLKIRQKEKETRMSDKRKRSILRNRIIRHINPMKTKLLKPSDKNHIPEKMRTTVANILDAINLESKYSYDPLTGKRRNDNLGIPTKRTEEFLNLKEQYRDILKSDSANEIIIDPSLLGDSGAGIESIIDEVIKMRNVRLDDMTLEQLNIVWDVLRAVEASITNAGKTLSSQKYKTTSAFAEAFVSDTSSRKNKKSYTRKHYSLDLETPYTFFSHYGQAGKDFYRMLRNAQDYEQTIQSELTSKMENVVSSEQRKKLENEIIEFTTENGDNLILSKAHIMNIYLLSKRKQAEGHLYGSGIRQPEINRKIRRGTKDIRITQEDLNKLFSNLTSKEKSIADNMQKLTLFLAEKGNKTTMSVYGYEKFTDPNYWTIKSAKEGLQQNVEEGQDLARSIRNMGAAKATVPKASNALEIGSVFEVFDNHASEMITYAAWLAPMEDANRLFNFSFRDEDGNKTGITMKDLLNRIGGERSADYWMNLMKDIQNGISMPADDAMSGIVNKAIGNVRKAAVASNIRVVVQQPTAYLRAAAVLSPENMIEGLVKGATKGNGWKKAVKYAPIAAIKKVGGFEVSSNPKQLSEILYSSETKKGKAISFAKEFPTFGAGAADAITWGAIWNACELQVEKTKTNLTVGSESFYKATAELFTEVIDQTQVVDGVLQRSQAMRSSNMLNKQATAFMGEPTLSLNLLMRTYDAWHNETIPKKRSAALKNMSRAAFALILSNVAVAIAQSAIDALRDDDEEKDYLDRFLTALTGLTGDEKTRLQLAKNIALGGNIGNSMNVLTWIPYIKDMFSICQGYTIERMDASAFGDFISAAQDAIKSFSGEGKWTMGYAATKTVMTGAKLFGSSVSNLMRDIESILRSVLIETENWKELYNMEKGMYNLNTQTSRFFDILYQALESGDSSSYDYIAEDLIENGIKPKSIESSMRAHRKNAENPKYKKEDMGAGIKLKFKEDEKKKEEKFEVDNLSSSQYIEYMHIREKILDDIISDYEAKGLGKMDVKTANSLLDAAYEYANKVSLEEASDGKYEIDEKWIRDISNKSGSYSSVASQIMQRKKKNK